MRVLDMGHQLASMTDQVKSPSEQVSSRPPFGRVDIGARKHPSSKNRGDFIGVDTVVLCFSSVNGFHVEGVSEYESYTFLLAQICNPVPGEGAFDCDHEILPVLSDRFQKCLPISLDVSVEQHRALTVNNAQIHGFCVQIDSAIILVLFSVEFHAVPPCGCGDLYHTFGYEQGGLNEYQGAVADMTHLQRRPKVLKIRKIEAFVSWAGTQVCHAAKLRR